MVFYGVMDKDCCAAAFSMGSIVSVCGEVEDVEIIMRFKVGFVDKKYLDVVR